MTDNTPSEPASSRIRTGQPVSDESGPLGKSVLLVDELADQMGYKLMTSLIVPRPIGWIGTISAAGVPNLAPYSFFNVVSGNPPTFVFSAGRGARKDTLNNVREVGEFTVNLVTEGVVEAMVASSEAVDAGVDESELVGVTPVPSVSVRPPTVGECRANVECRVIQIVDLGSAESGNSLVIGRAKVIHISDSIFDGNHVDQAALGAIGRHGGSVYSRSTDQFTLERP